MQYLYLVLFAFLLSTGQILFKKAALVDQGGGLFAALTNYWLLLALILYAIATVLWIWLLRTVPLSIAYPFTALGFILVPLAATLVFGEELGWRFAIGSFLVITGIVVINT